VYVKKAGHILVLSSMEGKAGAGTEGGHIIINIVNKHHLNNVCCFS
jgi:hypothetical protein